MKILNHKACRPKLIAWKIIFRWDSLRNTKIINCYTTPKFLKLPGNEFQSVIFRIFFIYKTKWFSRKFQLFGSPFWIDFELKPDAGIWRMWEEARWTGQVLRPGESGAEAVAGFIFLCSRGRANPIAILKACLPQKTFPVSHFPAGRQRVAGERDAAGGNSPSTSTSTFCGFAVAAKLAGNAKKPSQEPERKPVAGMKWRATRSRTPMPQDFTMCDASRIWCKVFFFCPFSLSGWLCCLVWFFGYFTFSVFRPKMSIYRKKKKMSTYKHRQNGFVWTYILRIRHVGEYFRFVCAHISWRTCSWAVFAQFGQGCRPKCVEEY